ncbi:MAG: MATE family efflux transporter [Spirochaetales bacterium]
MILLLNETLWSAGITLLVQCYSMRGLNAVAGVNIANTINNLFKVIFLSLGTSVGIIVGRLLGAGEMEEARETDAKIIRFSVLISCFAGLLMLSIAWVFPKIYNTNDIARGIATSLIIAQAVCLPIDAFKNATYFTLRSGGRTFLTFLFDGFSVIAINYPIAYILSRFTDASVLWIFISVQIGGLVQCLIGYIFVKKGVWLRNIVPE